MNIENVCTHYTVIQEKLFWSVALIFLFALFVQMYAKCLPIKIQWTCLVWSTWTKRNSEFDDSDNAKMFNLSEEEIKRNELQEKRDLEVMDENTRKNYKRKNLRSICSSKSFSNEWQIVFVDWDFFFFAFYWFHFVFLVIW